MLAAELRGELGALELQTRQGLACLRRLAAEAGAVPAESLRAAATVFRYERSLLAAEELEAWLDARGLTASDWNGYLRRLLVRERWVDEQQVVVAGGRDRAMRGRKDREWSEGDKREAPQT